MNPDFPVQPTSRWSAEHVARLATSAWPETRIIERADLARIGKGVDYWDMWPIADQDGVPVDFGDETLWLTLAAPEMPDPEERHALARIHLLSQSGRGPVAQWRDFGPAFPDGFTPGSREWSGSAVYERKTGEVTVYFTAAGRRGEQSVTFEQRLFETRGRLNRDAGSWQMSGWTLPIESVRADGDCYMIANQSEGEAGTIKAFRDPAWFQDPVTGEELLFFTASAPHSQSRWNGVIGLASRHGPHGWQVEPPVISADGVNNELERPHMHFVGQNYYLLWSTQAKVFAEGGAAGPTGLYGMVGPTARGPFAPLNGTGLVAANPISRPHQAYSWWVLPDLSVISFADLIEVGPEADTKDPALRRRQFGGVPAPEFYLELSGDMARPVAVSA